MPQMVLKLPQGHEDSEYVFSFEIEQRERGFYSERTDRQNHRVTEPSSTVLVYRYQKNLKKCNSSPMFLCIFFLQKKLKFIFYKIERK